MLHTYLPPRVPPVITWLRGMNQGGNHSGMKVRTIGGHRRPLSWAPSSPYGHGKNGKRSTELTKQRIVCFMKIREIFLVSIWIDTKKDFSDCPYLHPAWFLPNCWKNRERWGQRKIQNEVLRSMKWRFHKFLAQPQQPSTTLPNLHCQTFTWKVVVRSLKSGTPKTVASPSWRVSSIFPAMVPPLSQH